VSKLPVVSGKQMIKYLSKKGFKTVGSRGDHVRLKNSEGRSTVVVLKKELKKGTLLSILEQIGITRDDFIKEWTGK